MVKETVSTQANREMDMGRKSTEVWKLIEHGWDGISNNRRIPPFRIFSTGDTGRIQNTRDEREGTEELVAYAIWLVLFPAGVSDSRLSAYDISSDHIQIIAGGFERLLGIVVRNKPGVVIEGHIALPAETIKDDQQTSMFLVDARPHEIDDGDVVPRLTSRTESMAEHEPEGSFQHCFVSLLKTSFFVKGENSVGRGELLVRAREKAFNLRPVNGVRL